MRIALIIFLCVALWSPANAAMQLKDDGPKGKNWQKITDIHYMNKASVKRIKGTTYQAKVCNFAGNGNSGFWGYFDVRVDCATKKAWSQSGKTWIGPMSPTNYEEGVIRAVCK